MLSHLCLIFLAKLRSGLWLCFIPLARQTSTAGRDYFPFWRVPSARRTPASGLWHQMGMTCKNHSWPVTNFSSWSEFWGSCMKQYLPYHLKQAARKENEGQQSLQLGRWCPQHELCPQGYAPQPSAAQGCPQPGHGACAAAAGLGKHTAGFVFRELDVKLLQPHFSASFLYGKLFFPKLRLWEKVYTCQINVDIAFPPCEQKSEWI